MAKLNKQEVNAIASKLHRELSRVAEDLRKHAMENYTPSEIYSKAEALIKKRDSLSAEWERINEEIEKTYSDINEVCPFYVYKSDSKDKILDRILREECKLPEVPPIEDLKDEVTIAAIDDSFDTASYIESQIAKFR